MNPFLALIHTGRVSAGCHINDVMNRKLKKQTKQRVSAGCHINDVMNGKKRGEPMC